VPESERDQIFKKFYRSGSHPHVGGTGLGLAICRTIVEAHGGIISIISPPGGGAEFQIRLPRIPEETL
jgi:two-component system sensor histidine kinase KdpD